MCMILVPPAYARQSCGHQCHALFQCLSRLPFDRCGGAFSNTTKKSCWPEPALLGIENQMRNEFCGHSNNSKRGLWRLTDLSYVFLSMQCWTLLLVGCCCTTSEEGATRLLTSRFSISMQDMFRMSGGWGFSAWLVLGYGCIILPWDVLFCFGMC